MLKPKTFIRCGGTGNLFVSKFVKPCLITLSLFSAMSTFAQSGQKWSTGGNSNGSGDFIGTTNNFPLDFKTNNTLRMSLGTNGVLKVNNLAGTGNRLMQVDANGNLIPFPMGAVDQVLFGNGTWGSLPATGQWNASGSNLFWSAGNVGIGGAPVGGFKLEVIGDQRISRDLFVNNNLYVGGGIVISDKIQAVTQIKGWDFKVENDIEVTGAARFNGSTQLDKGFTFDGSKGIKFIPGQDNGGAFRYGNTNQQIATGIPCAAAPTTNIAHQFGGIVQVFDPNNPATGLLNLQTWSGGSSIDASVGGNNDPAVLLLNYFCGNDVSICRGANGGTVRIGNELDARRNVRIGYFGANPFEANTSLLINQSDVNGNALKINTWEPSVKVISIENPGVAYSPFTVYGDGRTAIRSGNDSPFDILDATDGTSIFRIKSTGVVYSREINVQIGDFPDYVFAKAYSLTPLNEVEKYIEKNHHLKGFEKAEVYEKDGANLGEIVKLQQEKIEELTLYLIQLKKEVEQLKSGKDH